MSEVDYTLQRALESLLSELQVSVAGRLKMLDGYAKEPPEIPIQFVGRPMTDVNRTVSAPAQAIVALMAAADQAIVRVEWKMR